MKRFARGALTLAFWLAVWAALALLVHRELLLPAPWTVVRRLCELAATGAFWRITAVSIGRVLLGVAGAVVLGVALAAACMISKTADALLRPLMTVVKSTPVASFVVLALIWIARDWLPVFIALLMVLPVVWSNVCTGIRSADPALLELARGVRLAARARPAADLCAERAAALSGRAALGPRLRLEGRHRRRGAHRTAQRHRPHDL